MRNADAHTRKIICSSDLTFATWEHMQVNKLIFKSIKLELKRDWLKKVALTRFSGKAAKLEIGCECITSVQ